MGKRKSDNRKKSSSHSKSKEKLEKKSKRLSESNSEEMEEESPSKCEEIEDKSNEKSGKKRAKNESKAKTKNKKTQKKLDGFLDLKAENTYIKMPETGKFKVIHWNVNGLRPLLKRKEMDFLIENENPDFICLNETKISEELVLENHYDKLYNETYASYWHCPIEKKGYSGTAIFSKYEPISVTFGMKIPKGKDTNDSIEDLDDEGRIITLEFEKFYLICCYTPNAGEGLKRLTYRIDSWDKTFFSFIKALSKSKNIILCGDLNVAHKDIDIFEPKGHNKSAGFTPEERSSFTEFLDMGFEDTFRKLHEDEKKFSYFSKRAGNMKKDNRGWRLDYFIINTPLKGMHYIESDMCDKDKYNSSDHIPLYFTFEIGDNDYNKKEEEEEDKKEKGEKDNNNESDNSNENK